jgi:L-alanine-DL-glutamate epimerase-like enolase superfamily enzyme
VRKNGQPLVGLAFDSIGRYGHGALLRQRFIPRLLAADPDDYADGHGGIDPHRAWAILMKNEKPGGHGERCGAVGLIDAALWDLAAKAAGEPLWSLLAKRYGGPDASGRIAVYASGGHYRPSNDLSSLRDDVRRGIDRGHRRIKIKIGGASLGDDVARIEAVLGVIERGMSLAVDGNGTFDRGKAVQYLDALAQFSLAWIEEPVHPLDFELHRDIAARTPIPLATGENLFSRDDARNLLRYAGLRKDRDLLQFDISLSYGLVEYLRILGDLDVYGWGRERCRRAWPGVRRGRHGHLDPVRRVHIRHSGRRRHGHAVERTGDGLRAVAHLQRHLRRPVALKWPTERTFAWSPIWNRCPRR